MTQPPSPPSPRPVSARDDYARVAHAFVELRGRGLGLASADLEILRSWRDRALPAPALLEFLLGVAEECELEERGFPVTLKAIDTRLRRALREGRLALEAPGMPLWSPDPESASVPGSASAALPASDPTAVRSGAVATRAVGVAAAPVAPVAPVAGGDAGASETPSQGPAATIPGMATELAFARAGLPPPQRN